METISIVVFFVLFKMHYRIVFCHEIVFLKNKSHGSSVEWDVQKNSQFVCMNNEFKKSTFSRGAFELKNAYY